jgi:hypothetical protein
VQLSAAPQIVAIILSPKTGAFEVSGATPRATLHLFPLPLRQAVLGLWSENGESLTRSVAALEMADAPFVVDRLRELAGRVEPRLLERFSSLVAAAPSVRPEQSLVADGLGNGVIENAWISKRYRIFATSPRTLDFLTEELDPRHRQAIAVKAEMTRVGTVIAATLRPSLGHFRILGPDGNPAGQLSAGGPPVQVVVGPVTLWYVPAPNDPVLREFTIKVDLAERFELAGNLYVVAAQAYEKDRKVPLAIRAYIRMVEERMFPASEAPERARVADKIRDLYRVWADAHPAKTVGGDHAARIAEARLKGPTEAIPILLDYWVAKDGDRASKAAAASALALAHGRLKQPYEAVEWIERCLKEGVDPGAEAESAVAGTIRELPGLPDRWGAAVKSMAAMRKVVPGFLGVKVSEVAGKGVLVEALAKGSPAEVAGIKLGDLLVDFRTPGDLEAAMAARVAGEEVELQIERGGELGKMRCKLAPKPGQESEYAMAPTGRLGILQRIHNVFGVFVKLESGAEVAEQETLDVFRNGEIVGEIVVDKVTKVDTTYPYGCAVCKPGKGAIQKGDEVRRSKP